MPLDPTTTDDAATAAAKAAARVVELAEREILKGLPNEQARLGDALVNLDFYSGRGANYIPRRPAEDPADYAERPKRCSQLTQRVVNTLSEHLYQPGPSRRFEQPEAVRTWIDLAYTGANSALLAADRHSTLNSVALLQVAPSGNPASPIRFQIWDSSAFAVWTDPEDCTRVVAVATIDRQDQQTRYVLWTEKEFRVYLTRKVTAENPAGGRAPEFQSVAENPYGIMPFVVVSHGHQCGDFWTPSPGDAIRAANEQLDVAMSDLAQAIQKHLHPKGIAEGVMPDWSPIFRPDNFIAIPPDINRSTSVIESQPRLYYLQAQIDITGAWADANAWIDHSLEMSGVPRSAIRMEQSGAASGISIIAEQLPLLARAKQRQPLAAGWENQLARVVLQVGAAWYRRTDLLIASRDPKLTLSWPPVELPLPGPDQDGADQWELENGLSSKVDILMRRRGISRQEAIDTLKRVAEDAKILDQVGPVSAVDSPILERFPIGCSDSLSGRTSP